MPLRATRTMKKRVVTMSAEVSIFEGILALGSGAVARVSSDEIRPSITERLIDNPESSYCTRSQRTEH